jgi:tetratricopeptide (TPR) repeat protein
MRCGITRNVVDISPTYKKFYHKFMAEKNSNEVSRDARVLFQKASEAAQRENLDYAITLFNQLLTNEPAYFDCRKALRQAQIKKAGTGGTGFFKKMLSGAGSSPQITKAHVVLRNNPAGAMAIAEEVLNGDPNSSAAHRIIVDAANTLELPRTAVLSYEVLAKNSPKDKKLIIEYARAVSAIGEGSRAENLLMALMREHPGDQELNQALKDLSARKTMDEGGYGALESGQGSYRDILKNKDEAVKLEQEGRVQQTEDSAGNLIAEYESRLPHEPKNMKLIRSLAELHTQKNNLDKALAYYQQIKQSDMGNDSSLDQSITNVKLRQFDQKIAEVNPFDPNHAELVAALKEEKANFQITECQKRVERFPTDMGIRYEMGLLYFHAGKINEAAAELQKAKNNPHKRVPAMNHLAQCFVKKRMYDMAARTFETAIAEKEVFDEEKKDLVYNLGTTLETMGKKAEAIEQFKILYEMDMGYRDVGKKVDDFYAAQ